MTRHPACCLLVLAAMALPLAACTDDASSAGTSPSSATSTPDATSDASPAVQSRWTPLSVVPDGMRLDPGAYGLTAFGASDRVAVIRAPKGYQAFSSWTFVTSDPFHGVGFLTADTVLPDPCGAEGHDKFRAEVDPGPTVQDLAGALVAQQGTVTTKPVPVTVDGYSGLYLTYQVAKGIDVLKCQQRAFDIFETGSGTWWLEASRERAALWILDVDGERLVLSWDALPGVPQSELREMTRMVESARFVEQ